MALIRSSLNSYEVDCILYIHKKHGIIGVNPLHDMCDEPLYNHDEWRDEDDVYDIIQLRTKIDVPAHLFEPLSMKVTIPESAIDENDIKTSVDEIKTPIKIEDKNGEIIIEDTIVDGDNESVFMNRLRTVLKKNFKFVDDTKPKP